LKTYKTTFENSIFLLLLLLLRKVVKLQQGEDSSWLDIPAVLSAEKQKCTSAELSDD